MKREPARIQGASARNFGAQARGCTRDNAGLGGGSQCRFESLAEQRKLMRAQFLLHSLKQLALLLADVRRESVSKIPEIRWSELTFSSRSEKLSQAFVFGQKF